MYVQVFMIVILSQFAFALVTVALQCSLDLYVQVFMIVTSSKTV